MPLHAQEPVLRIGRYELFGELAHGGMATVHLGRLMGPVGFARTVAIKRLHPPFVKDAEFRDMFVDEARVAARIRHPNVVSIIDVVQADGELFLVMDFVQGVSLQRLMVQARKSGLDIPVSAACAVIVGALHGLHAAHEVKGDQGEPLDIVHRDVSPQNIMVAVDGVPRVVDFGIAKARGRSQNTVEGQVKGKFAYMPPEQVAGEDIGKEADVYAAGVVLWELLTGRRLFKAASETQLITQVIHGAKEVPSKYRPDVPDKLDAIVMKAISVHPSARFASAREFACALEEAIPIASAMQTGRWVEELAAEALEQTALLVAEMQSQPSVSGRTSRPDRASSPSEPSGSKIVTVQAQPAPAPESKRGKYALVIGGVLAIGVGLFFFLRRDPSSSREASVPSAPAPALVATALPTSEPAAAPPDPVVTAAPSDEPKETAVAGSKTPFRRPPGRAAPPPRAAAPAPPPAATTAAPAPKPKAPVANCDPPYTIDARGVQRIKPQCL